MPPKRRKKPKYRARKWTESELRRLIRDELRHNADELAPRVLQAMLEGERKRPGKLEK